MAFCAPVSNDIVDGGEHCPDVVMLTDTSLARWVADPPAARWTGLGVAVPDALHDVTVSEYGGLGWGAPPLLTVIGLSPVVQFAFLSSVPVHVSLPAPVST